ncbi:selenocysteine-specific translation elongation factor [Helicobacter ailurogastricus]|uniref:selenocysteine-specific translation elongation factor n=1 Tax=Helicobacter ailurogastricus TaxID=1578720 RepID=UPI0022BA8E60|nr:selenocysteine-specific translation elongation factor [Helicobacter ailurogastricus]GLH58615.1 selenocysteine-specific translation elongation factor [Helicobacter ailurogastricus]GLH60154.1 selenocysteine-specific translation elongation factor [Helicobacter ailurogastricus]GMB91936.1 selenocysteine-specific translation elongation factor [Helicobacter ailurogastricus]
MTPPYFLLGTCGHVDHGKSALIKALTGFEGDTSAHEKERGITIDLSFSSLKMPGRTLGFIDVPGHKSLVSTMVGGSFGFDAGLFVVDANEGLKEQSLEHALVLSLLKIPCILVLSKADKCLNIEATKEAICHALKPYHLNILGVLACSVYDLESIQTLKDFLNTYPFSKRQAGLDLEQLFRLYVDRVFVLPGRGVAVSGSVWGGCVQKGDKLLIAPLNQAVGVKTLHQHGQEVQKVGLHERVALQLQGVKAQDLKVGMLLTTKGYLRGFDRLDVLLGTYDKDPLKHNQSVGVQIGTHKLNARVLVLEYPYATLVLDAPVFACYLDTAIISISQRVWGAAKVLNPIVDLLKKPVKLPLLKALAQGDLKTAFSLLVRAHKKGFGLLSSMQRFGCTQQHALEIARDLKGVLLDSRDFVLYPQETLKNVIHTLKNIYAKNPQALLSAKSLNSKHSYISPHLANLAFDILAKEGLLKQERGLWLLAGLELDKLQDKLQERLYKLLLEGQLTPQAPYNLYDHLDIERQVGDNALKALCQQKKVIRLCHNVFIAQIALTKALKAMLEILRVSGYLDVQLIKDKLGLSRKYAIAYLEHLDKLGYTHNQQGRRTLKNPPQV